MIRHDKRASFGNTADPTQVQASDWNGDHDHPPFVIHQVCPVTAAWMGPGFGRDEITRNAARTLVNLSAVDRIMLTFWLAEDTFADPSMATTFIAAEFSIDGGVNWLPLAADGVGPRTFYGPYSADSAHMNENPGAGPFIPISPLARREVMLRFVIDGDGGYFDTMCITLWGQ